MGAMTTSRYGSKASTLRIEPARRTKNRRHGYRRGSGTERCSTIDSYRSLGRATRNFHEKAEAGVSRSYSCSRRPAGDEHLALGTLPTGKRLQRGVLFLL